MAYLRDISMALFTPWGRLSQLVFTVLVVVIMTVHGLLQVYLDARIEDLQAYNPYQLAQLVTLWMLFSILSRRFHNSGNAALFLVPYFALTFAAYLFAFDHWKLAVSPFEEDHDTAAWYDRIRMVFQLLGMAIVIFALKDAGDEGANAHGPAFGAHTHHAPKHHQDEQQPAASPRRVPRAHVAVTAAPDPEPAPSGRADHRHHVEPVLRRGRITPVETSGRPNGFGRR